MLRQEMDIGYTRFIHRPGEKLGVFDNASDYEGCKRRVHCNATHGSLVRQVIYDAQKECYRLSDDDPKEKYAELMGMENGRRHTIMSGGEHNNVYFPDFVRYKKTLPQCLMQREDGSYPELNEVLINDREGIPMPAIDDPTLLKLYGDALAEQAALLKDCQYVTAYVLGFEMLYPEYFGLGHGDFRPASMAHFEAWLQEQGILERWEKHALARDLGSRGWRLWQAYRERAMADRCAIYFERVLREDPNHLCYYPTHGSTFSDTRRAQLSQQADTLVPACDGIEMGHILVEEDEERRNMIMTSHYASFGSPVIIPRLGNKQPDLSAIGGGKSFTPKTLRRFVYEAAGMGISTIFPIHWSSRLHDGEWFIKDTAAEITCREVFDEWTQVAPLMMGMGRLQPQLGLLAGDAAWISEWNPRWTSLLQDALKAHVHMTVISDVLVSRDLARRMPALLAMDLLKLHRATLSALAAYADAGGEVFIAGAFGQMDEDGLPMEKEALHAFLSHPRVHALADQPLQGRRVLRELFLCGPDLGVDGPSMEFFPYDAASIFDQIQRAAGSLVLRPMDPGPQTGDVTVLPLTDRCSMAFVLINLSDEPIAVTPTLDTRLFDADTLEDMLTHEQVDGKLTLLGGETRLIWAYQKVTREMAEETVQSAEKSYLMLQKTGACMDSFRLSYAHMRSGGYLQKRCALARALLESLAIIPSVTWDKDGLHLSVKVLDALGSPVPDAHVTVRLSPAERFERLPLHAQGDGVYTLGEIPLSNLYDPENQSYTCVPGRLRLIISAETGRLQGGAAVTASYGQQ